MGTLSIVLVHIKTMIIKHSFTLLLFITSISMSFGQTFPKVNEAELLICEEKYDEAAKVYDGILAQKGNLLAQDYYNAALSHVKNNNFDGAKKHLNKLAQLGIKIDDLGSLPSLVNEESWNSYLIMYKQFLDYSEKSNKYTKFEREMYEMRVEIDDLVEKYNSGGLELTYLSNNIVTLVLKSEGRKDSLIAGIEFKRFVEIKDSIQKTTKFLEFENQFQRSKSEYLSKYIEFLSSNTWPVETELNFNYVTSGFNSFLQMSLYASELPRRSLTRSVVFEGKIYSGTIPLPDSIKSKKEELLIQDIIIKAAQEEKIKGIHVFEIINPFEEFELIPYKAISVFVSESNCTAFENKILFEYVPQEREERLAQLPYFMESRADLGKKYIFKAKNLEFFNVNVFPQIEQSHFDSCETAKDFYKSKKISY